MAGSSDIKAGKAYVEIGARDGPLRQALQRAEQRLQSFGASVSGIGAKLVSGGAAVVTPLYLAARSFAEAGSELNDASARTGLSVEALGRLAYAASMTGADLSTVETAVGRMQKAIVAGAQGVLEAEAAFAALGLSARDLLRLAPDAQFRAVAAAVGRIPNPTARAAAAMQVFGKKGGSLLPMIADLDELSDQAERFGLVMSRADASAADELGDAFDLASASVHELVISIGAALAPVLTDMALSFASVAKRAIDWAQANRPLIAAAFKAGVALTAAGAALVSLGLAITAAGTLIGVFSASLAAVGAVLAAVLSPVGLVVVALGGLAAVFPALARTGRAALAWLGEGLGSLVADARGAFEGVSAALLSGDLDLAAKVLWTSLRVQWLQGTAAVDAAWSSLCVRLVDVFDSVRYAIAGVVTDLWAGIQIAWARGASFVTGAWSSMLATLLRGAASFANTLAPTWLGDALGLDLDVSKPVEQAISALGLDEGSEGQAAALSAETTRIGQENLDSHTALQSERDARSSARRAAAGQRLIGSRDELVQAREDLDAYLSQAAAGANAARGAGPPPSPRSMALDELDEAVDQGVASAARKVDVSGTFSAAAVGGMAVGDTLGEEQLKEQRKATQQLEKLNEKARAGQLVFSA